MPNAIFIDTSNLNTLYKVNSRFAMGVSYASCPEKLTIDAQALGTSFDVYLSVWPRQQGEGDDIINALSIGGVPFIVLREEIERITSLMKDVPGVGNIYICNALANFVIQARVSNFKSVINYGNRIALVSVQNKMLEDLVIFDNAAELQQEMGEDFTCYGDLDLVDVDAIKAQYDELTGLSKSVVVPLSHLIMSYRSAFNTDLDTVMRELGFGEYAGELREEPPAPPPPPPQRKPKKIEPLPELDEEEEAWERPHRKKARLSFVNVLLCLVVLVGCAITGIGYSFSKQEAQISQLRSEITPYNTETARYSSLSDVYLSSGGMAGRVSELLVYVQTNPNTFTIAGLEIRSGSAVIRCNSTDSEAITGFESYLEQGGYTVADRNQLDNIVGADNATIYNYNVVVVF